MGTRDDLLATVATLPRDDRTLRDPPADAKRLERGTQVGRYLLLEVLGAGGMGVVYRAYDPELDRRVAIKLLHTRRDADSSEGGRAWIMREAQALARLAHPNVVAVYDIGAFAEDRLFVAMELVDGVTLRAWLAAATRSWREVVSVMIAAGSGLAAAHAVGLVHRDFKSDNVLVGRDSRARVMDFGLARLEPGAGTEIRLPRAATPIEFGSNENALGASLTAAGAIMGTPAYLAPEIYAGHSADARSDQYAFGVVLFEALYGRAPYDMQDVIAGTARPPEFPAERGVPVRVQQIVARAIAIDPAARFPSMTALLAELAVDPRARRRRALLAVGGALALAGAAVGAVAMSRTHARPCVGLDHRLAGVWDDATKQRVRAAFAATKLPGAARAGAAVEGALDSYTHDWVGMSVESCEATRVHAVQTEEVLSLRQACLDRRLGDLRALVGLYAHEPSAALVAKGDAAIYELDPLEPCADVEALRAPGELPDDPRARALEEQLSDAKARAIAGSTLEVLVATQKVAQAAHEAGYGGLEAEADLVRGQALLRAQNFEDATATLKEALRVSIAAHRDDLAAHSALVVASVTATLTKQPAAARAWLEVGNALTGRTHDSPVELMKLSTSGMIASESGDPLGALRAHEQLLAASQRIYKDGSAPLAGVEGTYATTLTRALSYGRAIPHYERAIAIFEAEFGPDYSEIATYLSSLGICYQRVGRVDEGRAAFARAIAIRERTYGKNSPVLVTPLNNLAELQNDHGETAAALDTIERAIRLAAPLGSESSVYHVLEKTRADVLIAAGRLADARTALDDLLAIETRVQSSALGSTLTSRAELALAEQAWDDAASYAARAIETFEAAGGAHNPELWRPLTALGRARIELRDFAGARAALDRALAIGTAVEIPPTVLAPARAARARADG